MQNLLRKWIFTCYMHVFLWTLAVNAKSCLNSNVNLHLVKTAP